VNCVVACSASSGVAISTKSKPLEQPDIAIDHAGNRFELPAAGKTSQSRAVDVENGRPPMKRVSAMGLVVESYITDKCYSQATAGQRFHADVARQARTVDRAERVTHTG
jgi:hypothetical protein